MARRWWVLITSRGSATLSCERVARWLRRESTHVRRFALPALRSNEVGPTPAAPRLQSDPARDVNDSPRAICSLRGADDRDLLENLRRLSQRSRPRMKTSSA